MAKDNSNSCNSSPPSADEPGPNKSFVRKVRSRVSGLLPSSLSRWFSSDDTSRPAVRPREDDDESTEAQPPSKKPKIPSPIPHSNYVNSTFPHRPLSRSENSPFIEPMPGPSGVKSKSLYGASSTTCYVDNLLNGDKDSDSGESTSGYSSMPRAQQANRLKADEVDKINESTANVNPNCLFNSTYGGHSRSLFSERSLSPRINSSLSSRRPSFNASTFGSPNFVDRTLSTKRIINSPFYNGRTTYGGASAYSKAPGSLRESMKSQVHVKPANQSFSGDASLSKTARRILDTLEQYGTPVSDARKIPNPSWKKMRQDGLLAKYTGANPYLMREHKAANKELQVPTVPDLLKMKLKERLQDSTVAVRQIATTSKSSLNAEEYTIRTIEEEAPKHTNKMKTKVSSIRQKPESSAVEVVKLPEVSLPITTLPKFDFMLPPPPNSKPPETKVVTPAKPTEISKTKEKEMLPEAPKQVKSPENVEFTFSNPLVLAENLVSIIAINDFKFSDPLFTQQKTKSSTEVTSSKSPVVFNYKEDSLPDISTNFKSSDASSVTLKRKANSSTDVKLVSGSVEEMFGKAKPDTTVNLMDKFKPAPGTWECTTCFVRNLPDKTKCIACETPREKSEKQPVPKSFGEQFKLTCDKWECSACMVRNVHTDTKCIACATPKPGLNKPNGPLSSTTVPINSFGDKFKPPPSTWECPICMIRNKNDAERCAACETTNPAKKPSPAPAGKSFGEAFKKKANEWECPVCMICNPLDKLVCLACENPKPGSAVTKAPPPKVDLAASGFTFGIVPSNIGSKVKSKENTLGGSKTTPTSSIFGNKSSIPAESTVPTFTFGIPQAKAVTSALTKEKADSSVSKESDLPTLNSSAVPKLSEDKSEVSSTKSDNFNASAPFVLVQSSQQEDSSLEKPTSKTTFKFGSSTTVKRSANEPVASEAKKSAASLIIFSPSKPEILKADSSVAAKPSMPLLSSTSEKAGGSVVSTQGGNSSFNFTPATTTANTKPNLFNIPPKTTEAPSFSNAAKPASTTAPAFKFTPASVEQSSASGFAAATQPAANNIFGSVFGAANKPIFDGPATSKPPFDATSKLFENQKPAFEAPKPPMFDAPKQPTFAPPATTPAPGFGTSTGGFGTTSDVKRFDFAAKPAENSQLAVTGPMFSFGQSTKAVEPPKAPIFSFSNAAPANPSVGGFNFSSGSNPAGGFSFSAQPKVDNPFQAPAAPVPNMFGATAPVPPQALPPVQNGGFNFGSAAPNNNVKTGFNFGAPTATPALPPQFNPTPVAPSGVFSFGSANANPAPAPAQGGFNFAPAAPPTFSDNVKPTFNFTGGATPMFSAQPTGESPALANRKKIKAVRRTAR